MAHAFNKEERVAWEQILEGFNDELVMSRLFGRYNTDSVLMERTSDVIWRPQPYIAMSYDGMDQTANFQDMTQLSIPATIGFKKSVPWHMNAVELRDALQNDRFGKAARQRLASDINIACMNAAALQGTIVVTKSSAASGYADVALIDAAMNRVGIPMNDRKLVLSTADYNNLAADLAGRETLTDLPKKAYQQSFVGRVCGFETYKLDYANSKAAAAGGAGLTIDTRASAANYHVPVATRTAATGERTNIDNRYQQITISSTTSVAAGDSFTIAAVNEVHHITKADTGSLKTFRVISVDSSTKLTISPPIISNQGGSLAEQQYQNCVVNTAVSNSAIAFLNSVLKPVNPFWHMDAFELIPGRYAVPSDAGTAVMRATTEQGIEVVFQKWYDIKIMKTLYRLDTMFGVCCKQPEMAGVLMFSQT